MIELLKRRNAAQAAVDRYKGKPLRFGTDDCARMAAMVLRSMGHRTQLAKAGSYSTSLGAGRALKRAGYESLADALDALGLVRIAPAAALVADIVMLPGDGPFGGALTIAVGNGRVLGWHEATGAAEILQPIEFTAAWRL